MSKRVKFDIWKQEKKLGGFWSYGEMEEELSALENSGSDIKKIE